MQVQSHHQHQCANAASSPLDISNLLCIHELYNTPLTWWPNRTLCAAGNKGNAGSLCSKACNFCQQACSGHPPACTLGHYAYAQCSPAAEWTHQRTGAEDSRKAESWHQRVVLSALEGGMPAAATTIAHASALQRHKQATVVAVFAAWRRHQQQQHMFDSPPGCKGVKASQDASCCLASLERATPAPASSCSVAALHATAVLKHKQATIVHVFAAWRRHQQQQHQLTTLLAVRVSNRQKMQGTVMQAWRQWSQRQKELATAVAGSSSSQTAGRTFQC